MISSIASSDAKASPIPFPVPPRMAKVDGCNSSAKSICPHSCAKSQGLCPLRLGWANNRPASMRARHALDFPRAAAKCSHVEPSNCSISSIGNLNTSGNNFSSSICSSNHSNSASTCCFESGYCRSKGQGRMPKAFAAVLRSGAELLAKRSAKVRPSEAKRTTRSLMALASPAYELRRSNLISAEACFANSSAASWCNAALAARRTESSVSSDRTTFVKAEPCLAKSCGESFRKVWQAA